MMSKLEKNVCALVCEVLEIPALDVEATDDLQYSGMDSQNCISLIIAIKEHYHIEIPEEKLGLPFMRNINDICKLIKEVKKFEKIQSI